MVTTEMWRASPGARGADARARVVNDGIGDGVAEVAVEREVVILIVRISLCDTTNNGSMDLGRHKSIVRIRSLPIRSLGRIDGAVVLQHRLQVHNILRRQRCVKISEQPDYIPIKASTVSSKRSELT
jgi:hypothetical protein